MVSLNMSYQLVLNLWAQQTLQYTHQINLTMHWTIIPQCTICNRNVHISAHFCYKKVYCGIWEWCIVGSMELFLYLALRAKYIAMVDIV